MNVDKALEVDSEFGYFGFNQFVYWFFPSILVMFLPVVVFSGLLKFLRLLFRSASMTGVEIIEIIAHLAAIMVIYFLSHVTYNAYSQVRLSEEGLLVRIVTNFRIRWQLVRWRDVIGIVPTWQTSQFLRLNPFRMTVPFVIKVRNLTRWHRFLGQALHIGDVPVISVGPTFRNGDQLLDVVERNLLDKDEFGDT